MILQLQTTPEIISLDDYLTDVMHCADAELTDQNGIYDNFPILTSAPISLLEAHFSEEWERFQKSGTPYFKDKRGVVNIQAKPQVLPMYAQNIGVAGIEDLQTTLILHADQEDSNFHGNPMPSGRPFSKLPWQRAIANVAEDIATCITASGHTLYLPEATGWKRLDVPRVVAYNPAPLRYDPAA